VDSSPATRIIERFGGQSNLARLLGKSPSTVQYWGTTGRIPPKWHARLVELAAEQGLSLAPSELVAVPDLDSPNQQPDHVPTAKWAGVLPIGDDGPQCYVLDDGRRVVSRTGATTSLTGGRGGGNLESYTRVAALQGYLPDDFDDQMIEFTLQGVTNKKVRGITAELFLDICTAYVRALEDGALQSDRQREIAAHAGMFLAASAKVGLIALIDEATGYQYERAEDALRIKLKVFLEDEMRKWEKTFPDQLWTEFGRLTNWTGAIHSQRPRYWGKLVMELVYDYLDPDVSQWLRDNAPAPRSGRNYHQWLSSQYGLKRLTEHLWMLIGMAAACQTMPELKQKMAERFGRQQIQFTMWVDPPTRQPSRAFSRPTVELSEQVDRQESLDLPGQQNGSIEP
jgi:DNA-binding transcriptional regulator YdaS (Cro superfamily)